MATADEISQWDKFGAVTVRTPLADDQDLLEAAQVAMLRRLPCPRDSNAPRRVASAMLSELMSEQPLLDIVQHPWFEETAQQCLRTRQPQYHAAYCSVVYPGGGPWSQQEPHIDIQYTTEEW